MEEEPQKLPVPLKALRDEPTAWESSPFTPTVFIPGFKESYFIILPFYRLPLINNTMLHKTYQFLIYQNQWLYI